MRASPTINSALENPLMGRALSFSAGLLCAFSMAPASFLPALFGGMSLFYICLARAKQKRQAFFYGWLFGFGYFLFSLSWIGNALLVEGNPYRWAWPLAVMALPAALALFTAATCLALQSFARLTVLSGFGAFTALMALSEFLRGHLFTGFPWNLFGYAWEKHLPLLQILPYANIYFLTGLTIFAAALPGFALMSEEPRKKTGALALFALILFSSLYYAGLERLKNNPTTFNNDVNLRLVQPNIKQEDKWDGEKMPAHFRSLLKMSRFDSATRPHTLAKLTYVIWPETAISYAITENPERMEEIALVLQSYSGQAFLITGALLRDKAKRTYQNSVIFINKTGPIEKTYNKSHLVPFGEYIPFQKWINIAPIANFSGFEKGAGPQTLSQESQAVKFAPLICYEAVFPGHIIDTENPPDLLINVTNDAWYGKSAGPYQHLTHARFRAIEEGLPLVRVANTGFSALYDPLGRPLYTSALFSREIKDVPLPKKITIKNSPVFLQNISFLLFIILLIIPSILIKEEKHK